MSLRQDCLHRKSAQRSPDVSFQVEVSMEELNMDYVPVQQGGIQVTGELLAPCCLQAAESSKYMVRSGPPVCSFYKRGHF